MVEAKRPRVAIHETHVVKKCTPGFFNDRERPLNRCARHCLTAHRFAVFILRAHFPERKASQIVRTAEEESLINWHLVAGTPLAYCPDFAVDEQNGILG